MESKKELNKSRLARATTRAIGERSDVKIRQLLPEVWLQVVDHGYGNRQLEELEVELTFYLSLEIEVRKEVKEKCFKVSRKGVGLKSNQGRG